MPIVNAHFDIVSYQALGHTLGCDQSQVQGKITLLFWSLQKKRGTNLRVRVGLSDSLIALQWYFSHIYLGNQRLHSSLSVSYGQAVSILVYPCLRSSSFRTVFPFLPLVALFMLLFVCLSFVIIYIQLVYNIDISQKTYLHIACDYLAYNNLLKSLGN